MSACAVHAPGFRVADGEGPDVSPIVGALGQLPPVCFALQRQSSQEVHLQWGQDLDPPTPKVPFSVILSRLERFPPSSYKGAHP